MGTWGPRGKGLGQGGHDQLHRVMPSSCVSWGRSPDYWVWQHSVTQMETGGAKVTMAAPRQGTGLGKASWRKGQLTGLRHICQVEKGRPGLGSSTKARRRGQSQLTGEVRGSLAVIQGVGGWVRGRWGVSVVLRGP